MKTTNQLTMRCINLCRAAIAGVTTLRQWLILCAILENEGITTEGLRKVVKNTRGPNQNPIAKGTVTNAASRLESAGFIQIIRARNPENKNGGHPRSHYYLTEKGRKVAEMGVQL